MSFYVFSSCPALLSCIPNLIVLLLSLSLSLSLSPLNPAPLKYTRLVRGRGLFVIVVVVMFLFWFRVGFLGTLKTVNRDPNPDLVVKES